MRWFLSVVFGLLVSCQSAESVERLTCHDGDCTVIIGADQFNVGFSVTEPRLQKTDGGWILETSPSDSCPSQYMMILKNGESYVATEAFGNCNQVDSVKKVQEKWIIEFPACMECRRFAERCIVDIKSVKCTAANPLPESEGSF